MKYKTLFRLALKLVGVVFLVLGARELLTRVGIYHLTLHDLTGFDHPTAEWTNLIRSAPSMKWGSAIGSSTSIAPMSAATRGK